MTPGRPGGLREMLIQEATRLFATRGFAGTSIREVAEACLCTKPAVYHHFVNKEALFRQVVEYHLQRINTLLQTTVEGDGGVRACLHDGLDGMIDYCMDQPLAMRLIQRQEIVPEQSAPAVDACAARETHLQMLAGLIARGVASGELRGDIDPVDGALMVAGAIHFQLESSIQSGQWDRARVHRTIDLVLDGIAA